MSGRPYTEEQARRVATDLAAIRESSPDWFKVLAGICMKEAENGQHKRRRAEAARSLAEIDRQIEEVRRDLEPVVEVYNRLHLEHDCLVGRKIKAEMLAYGRSKTDEHLQCLEDFRVNSLS